MSKKITGKLVGVVVIMGLMVSIYLLRPQSHKYTIRYTDVFDTVTQLTGYAKSEEEFAEQMEKLHNKLLYYHKLFDRYHSYPGVANVKTINEEAGKKPVEVKKELFNLLALSKEANKLTAGKNNVAMGSVLLLWHEKRTQGLEEGANPSLPEEKKLQKAAEHVDIEKLLLDENNSTVYLKDPEMSLDVGSIGKGYAVELTGEYAKKLGIKNLLINVGGNVYGIGEKNDGKPWVIGIQNPKEEDSYLCTVKVKGISVVTSGDYQRYYVVDGKKYCHIIDPDTLMPPEYFSSVSVITEKSGLADALSTALFCMPYEEGVKLATKLDGVEVMWVTTDGLVRYTDGFTKRIEKR